MIQLISVKASVDHKFYSIIILSGTHFYFYYFILTFNLRYSMRHSGMVRITGNCFFTAAVQVCYLFQYWCLHKCIQYLWISFWLQYASGHSPGSFTFAHGYAYGHGYIELKYLYILCINIKLLDITFLQPITQDLMDDDESQSSINRVHLSVQHDCGNKAQEYSPTCSRSTNIHQNLRHCQPIGVADRQLDGRDTCLFL